MNCTVLQRFWGDSWHIRTNLCYRLQKHCLFVCVCGHKGFLLYEGHRFKLMDTGDSRGIMPFMNQTGHSCVKVGVRQKTTFSLLENCMCACTCFFDVHWFVSCVCMNQPSVECEWLFFSLHLFRAFGQACDPVDCAYGQVKASHSVLLGLRLEQEWIRVKISFFLPFLYPVPTLYHAPSMACNELAILPDLGSAVYSTKFTLSWS